MEDNINIAVTNIENFATEKELDVTHNTARVFIKSCKKRWTQVHPTRHVFEKCHQDWLDSELYKKKNYATGGGRKRVSFDTLSVSQKRRRTASKYKYYYLLKIRFLFRYMFFSTSYCSQYISQTICFESLHNIMFYEYLKSYFLVRSYLFGIIVNSFN